MTRPYLQFALAAVADGMNRSQQDVIESLRVENRTLREHLGGHRVRFTDAQRYRLAAAARRVGRKGFFKIAAILLAERHLRLAVGEYAKHYHLERNHQGLGNRPIRLPGGQPGNVGRVRCPERLGGVLKFYYREAA